MHRDLPRRPVPRGLRTNALEISFSKRAPRCLFEASNEPVVPIAYDRFACDRYASARRRIRHLRVPEILRDLLEPQLPSRRHRNDFIPEFFGKRLRQLDMPPAAVNQQVNKYHNSPSPAAIPFRRRSGRRPRQPLSVRSLATPDGSRRSLRPPSNCSSHLTYRGEPTRSRDFLLGAGSFTGN